MPFIISGSTGFGGSPVFSGTRVRTLSVGDDSAQGLQFHNNRGRVLSATGGLEIAGAVEFDRIRTLYAHLRLDDEANVFGSATLSRPRGFDVGSAPLTGGKAILSRPRGLNVTGRVAKADADTLNILLTIADDTPAGYGNTYSARAYVDGASYPIKAFQYAEGRGDVGVSLQITLARPSDRGVIEGGESFRFDVYDGTVWKTLFDAGKRRGTGYAITFTDGRPVDSVTVSTSGDVDNKLRKSPVENTTIYDFYRLSLIAADFSRIYDTNGNAYIQDLIAAPGLDLYMLLDYVFVTRLGFTRVRTTLPNYAIRRADFSFTGTFFDGIAGHIGAFSPLLFVINNVVWLIDSTAPFPPGFGSPMQLLPSEYLDAQFSQTDTDLDGYLVQYADNELAYDYTTNRYVDDPVEESGTFGSPNYTETERRRTFRDFFKFSNPLVPIRSEKTRDVRTTRGIVLGTLITMSTEAEDISYDTLGRIQSIRKDYSGLVPNLAAPGYPLIERTIRIEDTRFTYAPERFRPTRQILKETRKEVSGLITIDTEKQHLGQDFRQEYTDGFAAGNLDDTLIVTSGAISTTTETVDQNDKGQFEIRTRTVNFLTDPPHVQNATTDARSGDMSTNAATGGTAEIVVLRVGTSRTDAKIGTLAVAEIPIEIATALARRKLAKRKIRNGTITLKGLKLGIGRGTMFELIDRDGGSVGVYVCEGRQLSGSNLGTAGQATRQTLEVTEI